MKKALKIVRRLEKEVAKKAFKIKIINKEGLVIFDDIGDQLVLQFFYVLFFAGACFWIYLHGRQTDWLRLSIIFGCAILFLLTYFKGPNQTDNRMEVDLDNGLINIKRQRFFGIVKLEDKIFKTSKSNKVVQRSVPFSSSFEKRIVLVTKQESIPLFDVREGRVLDDLFLCLNLLVKIEVNKND